MQYNKKMFFSSKTESYDQQNYNPNQYCQLPTLTQGLLANDNALSKAIRIIQQLKQNLTFALKINETLQQQNQLLKSNAQRTNKKVNADVMGWQKRLQDMQSQKDELVQLLEETKRTLISTEQQYNQANNQIQKCNRIIQEQKRSYEELQQQFMNQSLNYVGDSSMNVSKSQLHYISEMERQIQELTLNIKKLTQQIQKNESKMVKIERQNHQFKKWMGSVLGLHKIVQGSQKILMDEIAKRILPV